MSEKRIRITILFASCLLLLVCMYVPWVSRPDSNNRIGEKIIDFFGDTPSVEWDWVWSKELESRIRVSVALDRLVLEVLGVFALSGILYGLMMENHWPLKNKG
jgi:hypothetical protein